MILFDSVTKTFPGGHTALKDISVQIQDGEFVFLIGPSGAGKSTLLRLLIRDIVPTRGSIYIDDLAVNTIKKSQIFLLRRSVGMVFQDFKILQDRTVFENVSLALEILGKKDKEIHKDVFDILSLVGLSGKERLFPIQLSAGEIQRVSIARAIVGGPHILLADEPTGNLDPVTAEEILNILLEVNNIGTTVVVATHNKTLVNKWKKRTIMLDNGCLISDELKGTYRSHIQKVKGKKTKKKDEK